MPSTKEEVARLHAVIDSLHGERSRLLQENKAMREALVKSDERNELGDTTLVQTVVRDLRLTLESVMGPEKKTVSSINRALGRIRETLKSLEQWRTYKLEREKADMDASVKRQTAHYVGLLCQALQPLDRRIAQGDIGWIRNEWVGVRDALAAAGAKFPSGTPG